MKYLKTFEELGGGGYRGMQIPFVPSDHKLSRLPSLTDIKEIIIGFSGKRILEYIPTKRSALYKTERSLVRKKSQILDKLLLPEDWMYKSIKKSDILKYYNEEGYFSDDPGLRSEIEYLVDYIISDSGRGARLNM